jgi:hypothetical protein
MKILITFVLAFLMLSYSYSQKITKIRYQDTSRFSKNGINYKRLAHRMVVEGVYNGKDLYIKNGFGKDGIGWCINGLKVNGNYTADEINGSEFKVDLSAHKLKKGEKVTITIYYKDSCMIKEPLLMNQSVIKERDTSGKNSLVIEGINYNASLLVVNPRSGKDHGIKEILVNGKKVENINMDVIEISFFKMKIAYEAKLKIEFKFEGDCDPFIINPEVINF